MSEEYHEHFLDRLDVSEKSRWKMAHWLTTRGHCVRIPPARKAPRREQWEDFADEGDLEICQRVEVKRLGSAKRPNNFTCARDWPYGERFIVCAKHAWDRANPKPYGFIYLNTPETHLAMLRTYAAKQWRTESIPDQTRPNEKPQLYLLAPIDQVIWAKL